MSFKKELSGVADAVTKIMEASMKEELKGNQHKIDANKNNKIDSHDFKLLRSGKKVAKEEVSQIDEFSKETYRNAMAAAADTDSERVGVLQSRYGKDNMEKIKDRAKKYHGPKFAHSLDRVASRAQYGGIHSEEVESVEEGIEDRIAAAKVMAAASGKSVKSPAAEKSRTTKVAGKAYGGAAQKNEPEDDDDDTMKKTTKGSFKRRYNTKMYKEQFSGLLDSYIQSGLKGLMENLEVVEVEEEVDNETYTKELEAQKAKAAGKGKKADVAAAAVQSVRNEEVEHIQERTLTEPEMKKREEVVKSMKKNLSGFKDRYGKRGKEVLYATATRVAKGEK